MQNITFKELEGLSPEQQELVLQILQEYSTLGESQTMQETLYQDYDEIPVDIYTFLHDRRYLGNALYDQDGRFTLYHYWEEKLKDIFPTNLETKYNTIILTGGIGLGKAQPLDSEVLTVDGFKKMRDLTLQDLIYGEDGLPHKLLGIFPQGKKKICKVSFNDGTSTLCCEEHLWTVYNIKSKKWTTVETKQLIDGSRNTKIGKKYNCHRYKIPTTNPINFPHKDVYIDPYIMGVLLGDGSIHGRSVLFTSADEQLVDRVRENLVEDYEVRKTTSAKFGYSICKKINTTVYDELLHTQVPTTNLYALELEKYKVNVLSEYKFIPSDYLYNDVDSRIKLLQGLMDTDGWISKQGDIIEYSTVSERLKTDVVWLVQSLGGIARVRSKYPTYKDKYGNKVIGKKCYNIGIKLPKYICPFYLSRKLERLSNKCLEPSRCIDSIEYVGEDECQCIYLDSENHLYLTNDFIVTHNTLVAVICQLYLLYRLLCLKDPYLYYGLQPIDKITIGFVNISLDAAKGVAMDKLNQTILTSEWFMSHGKMAGITNLEYVPNKHIELVTASSNNQIIGRALFGCFEDEVNFSAMTNNVEKMKQKMLTLISQIDARMKSRFMRGTYLPTLNIIASSKNSDQSFLDSYIETKRKNESKSTLIVDEPQWVVDSRKDSPIHFWVAVGNKFLSNELLPKDAPDMLVEEYQAKGYQMLSVPIGYWENFSDNIDGALTDIAGIATASSLKYISGVRWNEIKVDEYENPFVKEIIEVGTGSDDTQQYYDFFDISKVSPELMSRPLYIHLDMSVSGDKTGIGGNYIMGKRPKVDGEDASRELFYRVAFNVSIKAPKGREISFDKNRAFIRWLRDQGFNIRGISCDTYNSAQIQQQLIADGFDVQTISVDRLDSNTKTQLQYAYFKSTLYDKRIEVYRKCSLLTDEVLGLERESDGHIQHPEQGTQGSKDAIDAIVGSLWNASQHADEYAFEYGEDIDSTLYANKQDSYNMSYEQSKKQVEFDLEELLKGLYEPVDKEIFTDFGMGSAQPFYNELYNINNGIIV